MHVQFCCHIEPWCRKPSVCPGRAGSRTCLRFVLPTSVLRTRSDWCVFATGETRGALAPTANTFRILYARRMPLLDPAVRRSLQALLVSARFSFCGTAFGSAFKERSCLKRAKTLPGHGQNLCTASNVEHETRVMNMSDHVRMEDGASTLFSIVACSFLQW